MINYEIPAALPKQKISKSNKTENWAIENLLYYERLLVTNNRDLESIRANMERNFELYYKGILDPEEVQRICNPHRIQGFVIPSNFKNYPITNPKVQTLKGEELKRRFEWKAYVTNRDAISKKEEDKKKMFMDFCTKWIQQSAFNTDDAKKELERLQKYSNYEWKDLRETVATDLLHYFYQYLDMKFTFSRVFEDAILYGQEIVEVDIHNNKPFAYRADPKHIYWLTSPDDPYIDNSDAVIREYWLPISGVIDRFHDFLKPEDIDILEDRKKYMNQNPKFAFNQYWEKDKEGFIIPTQATMNPYEISKHNFTGYYDSNGNIRIIHCRWKSYKKVGRVTEVDEAGNESVNYVSEEYRKSPGEKIEWIWITEAWESTRIGEDIFVKCKPRDLQFRKLDDVSYCCLGYCGTYYDNPIFDIMKEYQIKYNAYMHRLEEGMVKAVGKIGVLDLASIPDGWNIDMWMHYATHMGWAIKDSFKEAKKGAAMGKLAGQMSNSSDHIDLEQGKFIEQNMLMLRYLEEQLDKVVGINPQRQGQVAGDAGLGVTQEAQQASSTITEYYFNIHDNVKLRTLAMMLETAKFCMKNKCESIQYITDDLAAKVFTIDGDIINEADYGLVVGNATNDQTTINTLQQAVKIALQTGAVDLIQLMDIFSNDSTASIRRKVEKSVMEKQKQDQDAAKAKQDSDNQALQQNLQMHQTEIDLEKQKMELDREKLDRDDMNKQLDRENKIELAQISALGYAKDTDVNKDSIPDVVEQGKLDLEISKHEADKDFKHKDLANKKDIEDKKIEQGHKDLEIKKGEMQNRVTIENKKMEQLKEAEKTKKDLEDKKLTIEREKLKSKERIEKYKAKKRTVTK